MELSTELRNALPDAWIDRLFERLAATYGKHWLEMWAGIPLAGVKATWASELHQYGGEVIGAALADLPKFPPTLPEFAGLCKACRPAPEHRALPPRQLQDLRRADPAVIAKVHDLAAKMKNRAR